MIGDDIFITEESLYLKIGTLVATIDLFSKRMAAKDERINQLEAELAATKTGVNSEKTSS